MQAAGPSPRYAAPASRDARRVGGQRGRRWRHPVEVARLVLRERAPPAGDPDRRSAGRAGRVAVEVGEDGGRQGVVVEVEGPLVAVAPGGDAQHHLAGRPARCGPLGRPPRARRHVRCSARGRGSRCRERAGRWHGGQGERHHRHRGVADRAQAGAAAGARRPSRAAAPSAGTVSTTASASTPARRWRWTVDRPSRRSRWPPTSPVRTSTPAPGTAAQPLDKAARPPGGARNGLGGPAGAPWRGAGLRPQAEQQAAVGGERPRRAVGSRRPG